jgi:hypothetical protein
MRPSRKHNHHEAADDKEKVDAGGAVRPRWDRTGSQVDGVVGDDEKAGNGTQGLQGADVGAALHGGSVAAQPGVARKEVVLF